MTPEQKDALRAPFDAKQIGKLPRVWCRACSDNKQTKHCGQHNLVKCETCGNKITEAHLHLDYVGHAATTDRLLQVDPEWTWEPAAVGPNGEPLGVNSGLWIRLTICGVTRLGFGDGASVKEMIGDAIRNAAMRFGVALDLWAKEDLQANADDDAATKSEGEASPRQRSRTASDPATPEAPVPASAPSAPSDGGDPSAVVLTFGKHSGKRVADVPVAYLKWWSEQEEPKTPELRRVRAAVNIFLERAA